MQKANEASSVVISVSPVPPHCCAAAKDTSTADQHSPFPALVEREFGLRALPFHSCSSFPSPFEGNSPPYWKGANDGRGKIFAGESERAAALEEAAAAVSK